jgi:cytochrome c biogenesis protein CcmG/thiol:disulfide interchange protein DsbE
MKIWFLFSGAHEVKRLLVVLGLLLAGTAWAKQLKLESIRDFGRTYRDVTVLGYNATDVYFSYEGGMTNLKLKYLEPSLQERFEYDAGAATAAEEQQAAAEERWKELMVSNMVAKARQAQLATQRAASTSDDSLADPVSKLSLIGKTAPAITGEKWLGEEPELKGKTVLVAFWAPWSIPCRKYVPELDRLQKKFGDKLAVVGVTSEPEAEVADMTEPKVAFASLLDPKAQLGKTVGVTSIPYVMLVDAEGVVRYQGHPSAITDQQVETLLAQEAE